MDRLPLRRIIYGTSLRTPHTRRPRNIIPDKDIEKLLARPTWSVQSMLPKANDEGKPNVSREQLHHLLKLSALPAPKDGEEERRMLKALDDQIHFVKEVQDVDTTGVEPLVAIRDETHQAIQERTVTLDDLQPFLDQEDKVGTNGTIRRRKPTDMIKDSGWDPFNLGDGAETRKKGRYFFVKKSKDQQLAGKQGGD